MWRSASFLGMVLLAAAASGITKSEAQPSAGNTDPTGIAQTPSSAILARYDTNHDGVLSVEERAVYRRDVAQKLEPMRKAALRQFDLNRNGVLDPAERQAQRDARRAQHTRSEARALNLYDANHNGVLDPDEQSRRVAAREAWLQNKKTQALQAYDTNRDGTLGADERAVMRQRVDAARQEALNRYDANHDGRIDPAERMAATSSDPRVAPPAGTTLQNTGSMISASAGGVATATSGVARLAVPAGAFGADARISVVASEGASLPAHGGRRARRLVDVAWAGAATLKKGATLEIAGAAGGTRPDVVIGRWTGSEWQDLASTPAGDRVTATITAPGRYALLDRSPAAGARTLTDVRVSPASRSPYSKGAQIAFTLGTAGPVSIRVYDTAGRLIRTVVAGTPLDAGEHTVRWEGGGSDGHQVSNGLYMVSVEAFGQKVTRKVAILR